MALRGVGVSIFWYKPSSVTFLRGEVRLIEPRLKRYVYSTVGIPIGGLRDVQWVMFYVGLVQANVEAQIIWSDGL